MLVYGVHLRSATLAVFAWGRYWLCRWDGSSSGLLASWPVSGSAVWHDKSSSFYREMKVEKNEHVIYLILFYTFLLPVAIIKLCTNTHCWLVKHLCNVETYLESGRKIKFIPNKIQEIVESILWKTTFCYDYSYSYFGSCLPTLHI